MDGIHKRFETNSLFLHMFVISKESESQFVKHMIWGNTLSVSSKQRDKHIS